MNKRYSLAIFLACAVLVLFGLKRCYNRPCSKMLKSTACIQPVKKKKILVMYSKGGGAHISAYNALVMTLSGNYEVIGVNPQEEILASLDPVRKLTFGAKSGEDLYNHFISSQMVGVTHMLCDFGIKWVQANKNKIEKLLYSYMALQKPDLIISVMPILNGAISEVAYTLGIPFLIMPPDFDMTLYINNVIHPAAHNAYCAVCFNENLITSRFAGSCVGDKVKALGFPLRSDFFVEKDPTIVKGDFQLPCDKPNIMILMGAAGSSKVIQYIKRISTIQDPVHLVVCVGRNERLRRRIERIKLKNNISLSVIGFTKRISDLMAACDILITKPGVTSVCEAIQMKLPLLIDDISSTLRWERTTVDFVKKYNLGSVVQRYSDINASLIDMLNNPSRLATIKHNMSQFNSSDFGQNIQILIGDILKAHA